jgi:hypothetical protein
MAVLIVYSESLQAQDTRELLSGYMYDTSYNNSTSEVCMSNLSTHSNSLQKTKSNEPNFIDMQALAIFSSMPCKVPCGI